MALRNKITLSTLQNFKKEGRKFPVLTCYDYSTARMIDEAGVEVILVGDTYGEVILGHDSTLGVTVDHLVTVTEAVRRGSPHAFLIGDMPFLSYQVSTQDAIRNAGKFITQARCDAVKLEVDRRYASVVSTLTRAFIPVIAHLGLKPQSVHQVGGYKAQGKLANDAIRIVEDARIMEEAGAAALLLEAVPTEVARMIAEGTMLPVIGCVAGPYCDGTVVVLHDMLGYQAGHPPRSVKQYANVHEVMVAAFREYAADVTAGKFPATDHSIQMDANEVALLESQIKSRGSGTSF